RLIRYWRSQSTVVMCCIAAALAYVSAPAAIGWRLFAAAAAIGITASLYPAGMASARRSRLRQFMRERFGSDGPYTCEVEISPAGLQVSQAGTRSIREWRTIVSIEDVTAGIEFTSNRAFASAADRAEFLRAARSYATSALPSGQP
ncbi:MAG: hypothetical protein JF611_15995, partial [Betaproteobacteria bacterium]|nr:hypothetical protein [Betaproteobacteria bacterium]